MEKAPYANAPEMGEIMILGAFQLQIQAMIELCQEAKWRRKLKCINTYAVNMLGERRSCMSKEGKESFERRCKHTFVKVHTSDQYKMLDNSLGVLQDKTYVLERDDYFDLLEQATLNCLHCSQGEKVEGCKFRKLLHKLSAPAIRDTPGKGECEFRLDNEIKWKLGGSRRRLRECEIQ